jgi:hypothetical protein
MKRILALLIALVAFPVAASRIVPSEPSAFDPINLRMTVDSCTFVPGTVRVASAGNVLKVTRQLNNCLVPGTPEVVDIRLGTLAPGDYRVEVFGMQSTDGAPLETLAFQVRERPEIAIFPPPPRPLTDYTGIWWNPQESGWGLSIHQSSTNVIFGAWFVYNAAGQPEWYTLQGGQWTSSTTWTGTVYRTTGPFFAGPNYDPRLVLIQAAGTATLEFKQTPGTEGIARFTYTVNNVAATKPIQRMVF